jgi:hypothetical protein
MYGTTIATVGISTFFNTRYLNKNVNEITVKISEKLKFSAPRRNG